MKAAQFVIKDIYNIAVGRTTNKFDCIIAWTGNRGNGKSTGAFRLGKHFKQFRPWRDVLFSRKKVMEAIEKNKFRYIMDDEAIRTAYKRNFQDTEQKVLVQLLNMYRDNFNVLSLCVPKFYSLDKDLRELIKIHIHVIERGKAVVHLPHEDMLYSDDSWDISYNQKIEEKWNKTKLRNPDFKPPYHKLTTFRGYLKYNPLSPSMQKLYEEIKLKKKHEEGEEMMKEVGNEIETKEQSQYQKLYDMLYNRYKEGRPMPRYEFEVGCRMMGKPIESVELAMRRIIKERGEPFTFKTFVPLKAQSFEQRLKVSAFKKNIRLESEPQLLRNL